MDGRAERMVEGSEGQYGVGTRQGGILPGGRVLSADSGILRQTILTLVISGCGAVLATLCGLPAAALIGSTVAVSGASFCRVPTHVPVWLRNMAFGAIGCSLGAGITGNFFSLIRQWPLSLSGLVFGMLGILLVSSWLLHRFFNLSKETALLSSSPGALSYSLALAADGVGDARAVVVIQSLRLMFITAGLPLIIDVMDVEHGLHPVAGSLSLSTTTTIILFVVALVFGYFMARWKVPAPYLMGGVVVSGLAHFLGLVQGRPQLLFMLAGFVVTGAVVGSRFTRIPLGDVRRLLGGAVTVMAVGSLIAGLFAAVVATVLHLPFGQVWVSYAPGGVEAMAAMALSLGYDSAFVATHHIFRILLLFTVLPFLLQYIGKNK